MDLNDPTLDFEGFGKRTEDDRSTMRASLAAMKKVAVEADHDPAIADALSALVGSYSDKMTGIDDLVVAIATSDYEADKSAMAQWQRGIDRQKPALQQLFKAARFYLTPGEISAWEWAMEGG